MPVIQRSGTDTAGTAMRKDFPGSVVKIEIGTAPVEKSPYHSFDHRATMVKARINR